MPNDHNSSSDMNAKRRRAVQLRLAGSTLADVRAEIGLSTPTIVSAVKAFKSGGWAAVDVKPRGRPRLDDSRETDLSVARDGLVQALSIDQSNSLWSTRRVTDWLNTYHDMHVSQQTAASYLQNWHLLPLNLYRQISDSPSSGPQTWLNGGYKDFKIEAKKQGATVLWIGLQTASDGMSQLYAHTLRGRALWTQLSAQPSSADYKQFFSLLHTEFPKGLALVLPNRHLSAELEKFSDSTNTVLSIVAPTTNVATAKANHTNAIKQHKSDSALPQSQLDNQGTRTKTMIQPNSSAQSVDKDTLSASAEPDIKPSFSAESNPLPSAQSGLTHLQQLEAESIQIMREVVAEAENPVMLYSVGKDSAVMLHLARKAFFPASPPFPLLHVDTTWKFQEMYRFRDSVTSDFGFELLTHTNEEGVEKGVNPFDHGSALHTDIMKTEALKQALEKYGFDIAIGGARRDEEKSRAKERVFSFRTAQHRWEPKNQRPELWNLYNTRKQPGESIRAFPISNWTELDIWQYIHLQNIPIVPLYYAAERPVVERDGTLIMVDDDRMPLNKDEVPMMRKVRFRTLGCYPLTGAVESNATTTPEIIQEMLLTKSSERQGRLIDHNLAASMEKKKLEGYF